MEEHPIELLEVEDKAPLHKASMERVFRIHTLAYHNRKTLEASVHMDACDYMVLLAPVLAGDMEVADALNSLEDMDNHEGVQLDLESLLDPPD